MPHEDARPCFSRNSHPARLRSRAWTSVGLIGLALLASSGCRTKDATCTDSVWYADVDGDGYGDDAAIVDCQQDGATAEGGDCDDTVRAINPSAVEICDGLDNDCDATVDFGAVDAETYYTDADSDGYGRSDSPVEACAPSEGLSTEDGDCDDGDNDLHPGAPETDCTDGTDYNCDGSTGYADADADGSPACEDCNDAEATTRPGSADTCDGVDNDCDGGIDEDAVVSTWYTDADGDGYGDPASGLDACEPPPGKVADGTDCDDADPAYHPGAAEACTDPADYNCDGSTGYADQDGDASPACEDCDDAEPHAFPGAVESCDGIDNDCDGAADEPDAIGTGTWYADSDGDGSGEAATGMIACTAPAGYVADAGDDCDPVDPTVYPAAPELCDLQQNDCDAVGWTADDEAGHVSAESAAGAWSDLTASFAAGRSTRAAAVTLPEDGTVWVCDGTWYVALTAAAGSSVAVQGQNGPSGATLDGANSGSVIVAEPASELAVTGVTVQRGVGTTPPDLTESYGGGVYAISAAVALTDVVLASNSADYGGGAYVGGGSLTADSTTFSGNNATYGGGLDVEEATCTVTDSQFASNTAVSGGGGIAFAATGSNALVITGGEITGNYGAYGGGVYGSCDGSGSVTVDGATIDGNTASHGGGAYVYASGSATVTLSGALLSDNLAMSYGGGLYVSVSSIASLALNGTTVDGNVALGNYGGGAYMSTSGVADVSIVGGSSFTNNVSDAYGGGAYISAGAYSLLTLQDTVISGNSAASRGGGLHLAADYDVALTRVTIDSNELTGTSTRYGAGAYLTAASGTVSITGSDFSDNRYASLTGSAYGGGLYASISGTTTVAMTDTTVTGNLGAAYGGGMYIGSSSTGAWTADGVEVSGNEAGARGAGVYVDVDGSIDLTGVSLQSNLVTGDSGSSCSGAGAYLTGGATTFSGCVVAGNTFDPVCSGSGGGIYVTQGGLAFYGTTVSGNGAFTGGGLHSQESSVSLDAGSAVSDNIAADRGGAVYLAGGSTLNWTGSSSTAAGFTGNTAGSGGGGVYMEDTSSTFTATLCDTGTATDDNLVGTAVSDVHIGGTTYAYGDDASFTCSTRTCR